MYDLLSQLRPTVCTVVLTIRLREHLFHAFQAVWYSLRTSVLPCRAPWQRPFLITQSGIEIASSLRLLNFLLDSLKSSIVRECSIQFVDLNEEDIGNIALLV